MRRYDEQFKAQGMKLSDEVGVTKAAEQLGIPKATLVDWKRKRNMYGETAFVGSGKERISNEKSREWELEKQNRELRRANEILKEALGFFVKDQRK